MQVCNKSRTNENVRLMHHACCIPDRDVLYAHGHTAPARQFAPNTRPRSIYDTTRLDYSSLRAHNQFALVGHTQRALRLALQQRLRAVRGMAGGQRGTKGNASRAATPPLRGRPLGR